MKKSVKVLLTVALICAIAGFSFGIVSFYFGFQPERLAEKAEAGELSFGPKQLNWLWDRSGTVNNGDEASFDCVYKGIDSLELEVYAAACTLIPTSEESWRVRGICVPSGFSARQRGEVLEIECPSDGWKRWITWSDQDHPQIELYYPQTAMLDKLSIEIGAGKVEMNEGRLGCAKLELECGAGSGQLCLDIKKKAKISCGAGAVSLDLAGKEEDFNYDLEYGAGEIAIGGHRRAGLAGDEEINHHAKRAVEMECGAGKIALSFTDAALGADVRHQGEEEHGHSRTQG